MNRRLTGAALAMLALTTVAGDLRVHGRDLADPTTALP
jgi:hypothetical protein